MINIQNCSDRKPNLEHQELPFEVFGHPQQVLEDFRLTTPEKRAVLAAWASDANAVSHLPRCANCLMARSSNLTIFCAL